MPARLEGLVCSSPMRPPTVADAHPLVTASGPRGAFAVWGPKRGCSDALLPAQSYQCHRLWPSRNASTGKTEYSAGPRATLTRDMAASDSFAKSL